MSCVCGCEEENEEIKKSVSVREKEAGARFRNMITFGARGCVSVVSFV